MKSNSYIVCSCINYCVEMTTLLNALMECLIVMTWQDFIVVTRIQELQRFVNRLATNWPHICITRTPYRRFQNWKPTVYKQPLLTLIALQFWTDLQYSTCLWTVQYGEIYTVTKSEHKIKCYHTIIQIAANI